VSAPPLVACAVAAALYALGGRGRAGSGPRGRRWREAAFYGGVATVFVVLEPPFDNWADTSFALHMAQHVLLLTVAPPLLVLGRPWPRMWMPFPAAARRTAARGLARGRWSAPLRLATRTLTRPPVAVAMLAAVLATWHVPALYGAAVRNEGIHFLEHASFLVAALVFWGPLLDAPPVRARIDHLRRATWFVAAALPGFIIALVLAYASRPLYPVYTHLSHRAFGLSAAGDQQLAAGIMWVPGSLAYFIAFVVSIYRWLEPGSAEVLPVEPSPEELSWT
jgi:putative membrane protein